MCIGQFLQSIPAPAWVLAGGVVGVIGTLGASFLSNKSNDRRFDKQLTHDGNQKAKDRAAELRRSVYLNAADELIAINAFLGSLATADPTNQQELTKGLLSFMTATSRVSLVANEATRQKVTELAGAYGQLFFQLMADASDAHVLSGDIKVNRDIYEKLHQERMRLIAAMRDTNENTESKYTFASLTQSLDSTTPQIDKISEEYSQLANRRNKALVAYAKTTADRLAGLAELQAEVSALLRQELDIDVDLEKMKADSRAQFGKAKNAANVLFKKLDEIQKSDDAGE